MASHKHDCGKRFTQIRNRYGRFVGNFCTDCRKWDNQYPVISKKLFIGGKRNA